MVNKLITHILIAVLVIVFFLISYDIAVTVTDSVSGKFFSPPGSPDKGETESIKCEYEASAKGDKCSGDRGCWIEGNKNFCCDYKLDKDKNPLKECECHTNENPCDSDILKCLACLGYSAAGGVAIPDACMGYAMCTAVNRGNDPVNYPNVDDACEAVAQENGVQYNEYNCVCNNQDPNQKYCNCCKGEFPNELEKKEAEKAMNIAKNLDCSDFPATHFNNKGQNSWAKKQSEKKNPTCVKIPDPPDCQGVFDFYRCWRP